MSWVQYVDSIIDNSKDVHGMVHVDKACLWGLDGICWTSGCDEGKHLKVSTEEAAVIINCLKSKNMEPFEQNGIRIGGVKYNFIRWEDDKVVICKKKGEGSIRIQACKTGLVIAFCSEGHQLGSCNEAVNKIVSYLESQGL